MSLKELWAKADLRKIQFVPGPWEKCRKITWASRMKQRLLKETDNQRQKKRWNKPEVGKENKVPVPNIVKSKVKESNKQIKKVKKRSSKHLQLYTEHKDDESRIQKKTHLNSLVKLESVRSKKERKEEEEKLSLRSSTSRKRRKANPRKFARYNVKWWQNSTSNENHTDFHYGVSLISKDTKQVVGEVTFDRNAKAVWELELASNVAALELTFGEDFLVLRVNVEDTTKRSFEIRFMHWSKMVQTTLISGDEEHENTFPVNLKTLRFSKKNNLAAVMVMQKLNTAFVWETLKDLHPVESAVHRAVISKYKRFVETLKPFLPDTKVIKNIWCFAISPAVMSARTMCELRKGVIAAFDVSGFNVLALGPVLTIFRKRVLDDLVMGNDLDAWVCKACSKIECFEKILKNEACMLK